MESSSSSSSNTLPKTMRAWRVVRKGHPKVALERTSSIPVPSDLKDGEVLVRVGAAALNPVGYALMGLMPNFVAGRPFTAAEYEISGTVIASAALLHKPGDKVFGFLDIGQQKQTKQGALAEYTRFPAECLMSRPENMSAIDAAGVALVAQTAYMCLVDLAEVKQGQTVFVNGGSSAVGIFGIQIAKAKGAKVWASASGKNEALVRGLGAEEFFDYTTEPLHSALEREARKRNMNLDIIFDAVGLQDTTLFTRSPAYLTKKGVFVSAGSPPTATFAGFARFIGMIWATQLRPRCLGGTPRRYLFESLVVKRKRVEAVGRMLIAGEIRPVVDSVYEFEDALKAYERQMSKRATGKVVVSIDHTA